MCPNCGWGLKGERDSVVFICENCDTAWEASESGFSAVDLMIVSGDEKDGTLYLPFWKMAVKSVGKLEINSYADFIRATNQPRVILEDWENQEMFFWAPAFKIRPAIFLNLSKQLTVLRRDFDFTGRIETGSFYPATLPLSEAFESIKITLANSIMNKRKMFSFLPEMNFKMEKATLVYLPFNDAGQEIIQKHMHISIHKKTLEYGRYL
jgi:hypothetical protein